MNAKAKIITAILVVFCVIGGLFIIGKTGFSILSGLRAYVGGEGLWAKGQKEATYQLSQYIFTGETIRYQDFLESLKIPLGDRVARLELEKSTPVYEIIFQGFIDGGNHPEDIPTMISLYKKFKTNKYVSTAIEQWEVGDSLIKELLVIGEEIHQHIIRNNMGKEQAVRSLSTIDEIQKQFNKAETLFSYNMSEAARWAGNLLFVIMLIFTGCGGILCLVMLRLISGVVSDLNTKNAQLETQSERERVIRKELKDNEVKLKETQQIARLGSWELDVKTNKLWWSDETYRIFGFITGEETTYDVYLQSIHPEDRLNVADSINRAIQHGIPLGLDYRIILPSGDIRYLHEESRTILDDKIGEVVKRTGSVQDITEQKRIVEERENLIKKLEKSLEEIKALRGILPLCSYCKKIRNDKGYWEQVDVYIHEHSAADISHGICPDCMKKHYPEYTDS